jgi:hypothetical protein
MLVTEKLKCPSKIRESCSHGFITTVINTKTNKKGKSHNRLPYSLQSQVKFDNMDIIE